VECELEAKLRATTQCEDVGMQCAEELGRKRNDSETVAKPEMQDTVRSN
jgi:hypothetical protein